MTPGRRSDCGSHIRYRPQARRLNAAGFSFAVARRGELLLLPFKAMLLSEGARGRKSGSPPLFAPSFKVQRNTAHNRLPGCRPRSQELKRARSYKGPPRTRPCSGADRPSQDSPRMPDSPATLLEAWGETPVGRSCAKRWRQKGGLMFRTATVSRKRWRRTNSEAPRCVRVARNDRHPLVTD